MSEPAPTRRWFRFSLRTMLLLVTVICILTGYLVWAVKWERKRKTCLEHSAYEVDAIYWPAPMALRPIGSRGYYGFSILTNETDEIRNEEAISRLKELFPEAEDIRLKYIQIKSD